MVQTVGKFEPFRMAHQFEESFGWDPARLRRRFSGASDVELVGYGA